MTIRIVALNCWGGRLSDKLIPYLQNVHADIYCLSEIYQAANSWVPESLLYAGRDGDRLIRARLYDEIQAALPGYRGFFMPALEEWRTEREGGPTYPVQWGIATFVRSTLPVIRSESDFVFGRYAIGKEEIPPPRPRTAHCFRVRRPEDGRELVVAHLHGLWHPDGKIDSPERKAQVHALIDLIHPHIDASDPLIVCGDLNVLPYSYTVTALEELLDLTNLITYHNVTDTRTSYYGADKPHRYADYALVSRAVGVKAFLAVESPEVSDHRPLLFDIE